MMLDFDYHRPQTLKLAVRVFHELNRQGRRVLYYGGGTEIITLGRVGELWVDSVIDTKVIPETRILYERRGELRIGSNVTLTELSDHPLLTREFPLLSETVNEIADRTARNKITLGGNICGQIIYREAILPLLLCDSRVFIAGRKGIYSTSVHNVFREHMRLRPGELMIGVATADAARHAPYVHIKRRKAGEVGYPIVTAAAIRVEGRIRIALSGVCAFPFRFRAGEDLLNRREVNPDDRVEQAVHLLPAPVLDDFEASQAYRVFVLKQSLLQILSELGD